MRPDGTESAPEVKKYMTFKEAFEGWKQISTVSESTKSVYASGFKKLTRYHHINMSSMTLDIMQDAVDTARNVCSSSGN